MPAEPDEKWGQRANFSKKIRVKCVIIWIFQRILLILRSINGDGHIQFIDKERNSAPHTGKID